MVFDLEIGLALFRSVMCVGGCVYRIENFPLVLSEKSLQAI